MSKDCCNQRLIDIIEAFDIKCIVKIAFFEKVQVTGLFFIEKVPQE